MNLFACALFFTTKIVSFIYALIGFGILIAVHELGHFVFCKIFHIHTPTFSIGMGPTIFQKKIGQTNFRIAAIPLGGYVEIAGLAEEGQGKQEFAKDSGQSSFQEKAYWKKLLVLMGGIIFNLILAYSAYVVLFVVGMPHAKELHITIESITKDSPAEKCGLQPKDIILSFNKKTLSAKPKTLAGEIKSKYLDEIKGNPGGKVKVSLLRNNNIIEKEITLGSKKEGIKTIGWLGVSTHLKPGKISYKKYSLLKSFKKGALQVKNDLVLWAYSIKIFIAQKSLKGAGGPIMILSQSSKMAQKGFRMLLRFLAFLSINLAVINILPIGALDGGQVVFETIEAILRRKIPSVIRNTINLASWVFLLGLIALLSYNDIISLFKR